MKRLELSVEPGIINIGALENNFDLDRLKYFRKVPHLEFWRDALALPVQLKIKKN